MLMTLKRIGQVSMAAGAAVVMAMGASFAPAQAANLKFSFTTDNSQQGSFLLDTSVKDENSTVGKALYSNAIKDLTFNGSLVSSTRNLEAFNKIEELGGEENETTFFSLGEFVFPFSFIAGDVLGFTGLNPDQLSSNPEDYNNSFVGGRYASMSVAGLEASDPTAVPEPTSAVSLLALGALSAGSLMKRKMKKTAC